MILFFIEAAVKSSCLLGVAALATHFGRRTSAASRHLIWTFAVAGLLLLPILSSVLPRWDVAIPGISASASVGARAGESPGPTDLRNSAPDGGTRASSLTTATDGEIASSRAIGGRVSSLSIVSVLPVVYASGVLLLLVRLVHERWSVGRLARRAVDASDPAWTRLLTECSVRMDVRRPVRLLRSLERSMPMAFGTRRPCILIPSVADTWSDDRRRAVLLHELAHIARHDCLTQLMAAVACAIYWIHPGAWWIARRLRTERELACDDRVLSAGTHARDYAAHLLELAYTLGGYRAPALVVSMARPRQVEGRMIAVLDAARNRTAPAWRGQLAAAAIAGALLVPIAAVQAMTVPANGPFRDNDAKPDAQATQQIAAATAITKNGLAGTWEIRTTHTAPVVYLRLSESAGSSHGSTIGIERLEGLAPALLSGAGGAVKFAIRRDAGVMTFAGTFQSGVGAGTYTFTPSASFPAELTKRGFARPTPADQYWLARGEIGFTFLAELTTQRYARPDLSMLVQAAHHGVDLTFVREMGGLGYRLGTIEALMAQRDHGVSPQYIRELGAQGLTRLSAEDLIRARDHGVSAQYVGELRAFGYGQLSLDGLIGARDHGVSPEYVRDLTALGYQHTPLDALIAARDHGISPEYIRELRDVGYRLTLDELTKARDHGVRAEYVRQLKAQGRDGLTLDELVALRDRGVAPQYVAKGLKAVSLIDLVMDYHNRMFRALHRWLREGERR